MTMTTSPASSSPTIEDMASGGIDALFDALDTTNPGHPLPDEDEDDRPNPPTKMKIPRAMSLRMKSRTPTRKTTRRVTKIQTRRPKKALMNWSWRRRRSLSCSDWKRMR